MSGPVALKFSQAYGVVREPSDDWFDPILTTDTKLFVDPFLIFKDSDASWRKQHGVIIRHFDHAFQLLAESGGDPENLKWQLALALLTFPEPREMCLGYTEAGTRGSGSGRGNAKLIAEAMWKAIQRGVEHLEHFEQLGIFQEGIGPDRVSDIVCTVIKPRLVEYTQAVARRHGIPLVDHRLSACGFDPGRRKGPSRRQVQLPTNPRTKGPVVLVPARFLADLPELNAEDWFYSDVAAEVRNELSHEILQNVKKRDIVQLARRNWGNVERWVQIKEQQPAEPYDLDSDPNGVYRWADAADRYVRQNPLQLSPPSSDREFLDLVSLIVERFKHFVEERGHWSLLWNDDGSEKNEEAAQLAFHGIAASYCEANGIVVDREVDLGRGPVDFKFSNGYRNRALLEVKKLHNGRFWNGLEQQLVSYQKSDRCRHGWLLAVRYQHKGVSRQRTVELPGRVASACQERGLDIKFSVVDARRKVSASKL